MTKTKLKTRVACGAGRAAHDVALGALVGGNLFGRFAMGPALQDISDKSERGRVLNRAWRRYGNVNSLALLTLVGGWLPARSNQRRRSMSERALGTANDVAVGAVVATGLASALSGVGFAQQAPGGAVPMESGHEPAAEATARATELKRIVNVLGACSLASELALAAVNAASRST
jgi:hypothetical protein